VTAPTDASAFVAATTRETQPPLVPEISLRLATDAYGIFQAADRIGAARPFWAFAWPGGQALARHLLDHPEEVTGRRVLDLGTGSGLGAIAAMRSGAASVLANDTDPFACTAALENATANAVAITTSSDDLLGSDPEVDLVLIGELFYEPDLATRVTAFLERAQRRGASVLFADRTSVRRPALAFELVTEVHAPLTPSLEIGYMDRARLWRLAGHRRGGRRSASGGGTSAPTPGDPAP
jgi:predicted nicotinamide N-methyase